MTTTKFIKLVRDRVGNSNDKVIYKPTGFTDNDFHWALVNKLLEEAHEYQENREWLELIDVYEVILALVRMHGKTVPKLVHDADERRLERGGYFSRLAMWIRREDGKGDKDQAPGTAQKG